jgi:NDP-sugar pyrophosphorylase family protein
MQAYLLAAGLGTRLAPTTHETPKPMLDVGGCPLLEHTVRHLHGCGFNRMGMNLHHLPQAVRSHFGSGESMGLEFTYSYETELLGTAGGVKKLSRYMQRDEPFLIHAGDVFTNHDFRAMARFHRQRKALVTMLVHERPAASSALMLDLQGRVERLVNRVSQSQRTSSVASWCDAGVWMCSPEFLEQIPAGVACDLVRDVLPPLLGGCRIYGFPLDGCCFDVDTAADLNHLRSAVTGAVAVRRAA